MGRIRFCTALISKCGTQTYKRNLDKMYNNNIKNYENNNNKITENARTTHKYTFHFKFHTHAIYMYFFEWKSNTPIALQEQRYECQFRRVGTKSIRTNHNCSTILFFLANIIRSLLTRTPPNRMFYDAFLQVKTLAQCFLHLGIC